MLSTITVTERLLLSPQKVEGSIPIWFLMIAVTLPANRRSVGDSESASATRTVFSLSGVPGVMVGSNMLTSSICRLHCH